MSGNGLVFRLGESEPALILDDTSRKELPTHAENFRDRDAVTA